ncbi:ornithine cyclodeaminase family protein [Salimicrobium salexigens]|uniref:Ornithine cyclodeaminase n=1 Tax=Salimicrobium salexigens TaxID=908941 RepID=A0ABY1KKR5_9BACI|nr:ornithine cyclodeaminase family protein [Salimicrobium salexigens]SIS45517.1 ornithine cyclodeaminase [Salimicrobium salexigens]
MKVVTAEEIQNNFSMKETMDVIEEFYVHNKEEFTAPERMHVEDGGNTALLMPAFHGEYYAAKLAGIAPGNKKYGKDTLHGIMVLHDRYTMEPLFLCDAIAVTALRTGALGGLGVKYLAKEEASVLGIIGTGTQGWSHLHSALAARDIKEVHIFNRTKDKANSFKERAEQVFPEVKFNVSALGELVVQSDIVITTTTSLEPVLPELSKDQWKGKLVVGVGSFRPVMQELSDQVLKEAEEIHVDSKSAFHESGDMIRAENIGIDFENVKDLDEIISEKYHPEEREEKLIVFKSVGASIFDLITARSIYEKYYK